MREWLSGNGSEQENDCECTISFEGNKVQLTATDCAGDGDLRDRPACRATVIDAVGDREIDSIVARDHGTERIYRDGAAAFLLAAGRFATRVEPIDERLAERARRDPLAAATEAVGRAGTVADLAAETGFALVAERADSYERALQFDTGPTVSDARIGPSPPEDATLQDRFTLETGAIVRLYETPPGGLDSYHIEPREQRFDSSTLSALDSAYERLADPAVGKQVTPYDAASEICPDGQIATAIGTVLAKHTGGLGILEDLFADPDLSDVFATAPVTENSLRVRVDGETRRTNVRLTESGANAFASTFRRTSGRAFSQASPTLDATATVADRQLRVAGIAEPVSDGLAFAFRAHDSDCRKLSDLVANGTMTAEIAAVLSIAVERGSACLVAGPRGAGKTTTLGALLWELPPEVRTTVLEDTPELPVTELQEDNRNVQALRTSSGDGPSVPASEALRTALRFGAGALVVGEVRGEEARVLYEAMRVGSGDSAVLGTIHGKDGDAVRERLRTDLDVSEQSFAATDLVLTLRAPDDDSGYGIASMEEVVEGDSGVRCELLYECDGRTATSTGRIERGNSHLVHSLAAPDESYETVLDRLRSRRSAFEHRVGTTSEAGESPRERGRERCLQ